MGVSEGGNHGKPWFQPSKVDCWSSCGGFRWPLILSYFYFANPSSDQLQGWRDWIVFSSDSQTQSDGDRTQSDGGHPAPCTSPWSSDSFIKYLDFGSGHDEMWTDFWYFWHFVLSFVLQPQVQPWLRCCAWFKVHGQSRRGFQGSR